MLRSTTDSDGLIDRAAAELDGRLIRYVDQYGDTYFNKLQMGDLQTDWQSARGLIETSCDEDCWQQVEAMIEECRQRTHLYVKFVGD